MLNKKGEGKLVASGDSVLQIMWNSLFSTSSSFTSACNIIIKINILCGMINMFDKWLQNEQDNAPSNCSWSQIKLRALAVVCVVRCSQRTKANVAPKNEVIQLLGMCTDKERLCVWRHRGETEKGELGKWHIYGLFTLLKLRQVTLTTAMKLPYCWLCWHIVTCRPLFTSQTPQPTVFSAWEQS